MCFAPQRRALFRHLNWSEPGVFCTFWLGNVLRATTACTFSTSQLPKVVRTWCVLYILTWTCASRHNGVQFFISHLASWFRTRRFSEPTFRPSGATNHWKNTVFGDFPTFSRICIFFLLTLSLLLFSLLVSLFSLPLPCSAFHLSILSEVWLLNFLRLWWRRSIMVEWRRSQLRAEQQPRQWGQRWLLQRRPQRPKCFGPRLQHLRQRVAFVFMPSQSPREGQGQKQLWKRERIWQGQTLQGLLQRLWQERKRLSTLLMEIFQRLWQKLWQELRPEGQVLWVRPCLLSCQTAFGWQPCQRDQQPEAAASSQTATKTNFYRMGANDGDLMNIQKSSKSQPTWQESEEAPAGQAPEKVLSLAMFLKSSQEAAIYHTVKGEKRRGLLIDPGVASGSLGPKLFEISWSIAFSTTRLTTTSPGTRRQRQLLECLESPMRPWGSPHQAQCSQPPHRLQGDVLGGAGSLCPALVGNPALRQQQTALFADWFPNGDGLLAIHREDMLGPNKEPMLLRLLLTDSGHYLPPVDGKEQDKVPSDTKN